MDPLDRPRRRYDKGDYRGAVVAFTEVITVSSSHVRIPALEGRARTYLKLNLPKLALKDAKDIIELAPGAARGYLIAGEICKLLGKEETALKLCQRGLIKVTVLTDDRLEKLRQLEAKLRFKLGLDKNTDPLTMLPVELATMVMEWLETCDLVRCLRLSKAWKVFLESQASLWTTFDSSKSKHPIPKKSLQAFLKRSQYTLDKATIKTYPEDTERTIMTVASLCKNLSYLKVRVNYVGANLQASLLKSLPLAKNLKTVVFSKDCMIHMDIASKLLATCPSLCKADFQCVSMMARGEGTRDPTWSVDLPGLTHLTFKHQPHPPRKENWWPGSTIDGLKLFALIRRTPNLIVGEFEGFDHTLDRAMFPMADFSELTKLKELSLNNTELERMPRLPQSLTYLDMTGNDFKVKFDFADLEFLDYHTLYWGEESLSQPERWVLPNLEEFHSNRSNSIEPALLEFLLRASIAAGNLKILAIGGREFMPEEYPPCDSVIGLDLSWTVWWDDDQILAMLDRYPNVTELLLSHTRVTGYALKKITTRPRGPLAKVVLQGCEEVSPDTYEYLEKQGTVVVR